MKTNQLKSQTFSLLVLVILLLGAKSYAQQKTEDKPNFLVIVADDMGFSDMGAFGGEISTPNLDKMAEEGTRYTNYYVAPTCSPTRSMLMTGIDNHLVGLGNMYEYPAPNQLNEKGYEGYLTNDVPTVAEILKENGYHTYMAGKWHLGKDKEHIPAAQGFERSFSMLSGSGSYFSFNGPDEDATPNHFVEGETYLNELPKNYYATTTFTNKIISYIDENKEDGKPFFAYLAHQAPHDPLMAPEKYLRKYKGFFDKGWDVLRDDRLENMVKMGILSEKTEMGERLWYVPGFDKLKPASQVVTARKMEVYAAVLDYMDMEIGRLMDYLEKNDLKKNTYIVFFSDNGPDVNDKASTYKKYPATAAANWMAKTYIHGFQNWGRAESFTAYGPSWAQVSTAPFYGFKYTTYDGGIRSPLIVISPHQKNKGSINTEAILHVKDIAPTFLELAGVSQSDLNTSIKMQGKSWVDMLHQRVKSPRTENDYLGTELWNAKSIRKGDWKIVNVPTPIGTGEWQLFNVKNDPGERFDLALENPEKLSELKADWDEYKMENNVILPNRTTYDGMEDKLPPRPPVYAPDFGRGSELIENINTKQ
ncbi:arylsulfatase [Aestuariivivens sediminis]|uniref:arylsulfatase n=1 Tax=Aestuariivivens sediminis TaxID=2913557 RepID=UPI001F57564D|nr:arylsulfatase [Aestuariivivens sediminis]